MELVTGRPQDKRIDKEERDVSYTHMTLPTT